ncbi:hypothetical protein DFH94DRAFT_301675 [Russula ochroleuca]|uniref:Uncharacterized protein n=1 Tax=Russula ochroleuca TaxID=152965 RepID=A0A9P5ML92_9AGAM|nr:hypothetical protein DFH94DRAFT_301675 [Russula ochroleuca]
MRFGMCKTQLYSLPLGFVRRSDMGAATAACGPARESSESSVIGILVIISCLIILLVHLTPRWVFDCKTGTTDTLSTRLKARGKHNERTYYSERPRLYGGFATSLVSLFAESSRVALITLVRKRVL